MEMNIQRDGKVLTVIPEGRIDTLTAPEFLDQVEAVRGDADELIVDFDKVTYVSSAGLRVLLTLAQEMEDRDGSIKGINVSDFLRKAFSLTGFLDILNVD